MKKLFRTYELQITPLTPVHVGSGEELNPGEYFVFSDEHDWPVLFATDIGYLGSWLQPQSRQTLESWVSSDPIAWVTKVSPGSSWEKVIKKYARFQSDLTKRVAGEIRDRWGRRDSRLGVVTMQRPAKDAVIPGSSIKGAIRTALLWSAVRKPLKGFPDRDPDVAVWERRTLGSKSGEIQDDPLRYLKVGDAVAEGVRTWVLDTVHAGMKSADGKTAELQDYRECLPDEHLAERAYTISSRLTIADTNPASSPSGGQLSAERILKSCRDFYGRVIECEREYWRGDDEMIGVYDNLQQRFSEASDGAPIRIGWGSGMDSVSLNLAKQRGAHPPRNKRVGTRRLLDGTCPPGWALIRLLEV